MSLEIVYVLSNPAMPGLVKIGKSKLADIDIHLAQLYSTGVPFPFELEFACNVANSDEVERALHVAFAPYRANSRREFFKIYAAQAIAVLKLLHVEDATQRIGNMVSSIPDEDVQAREQYKARRPNLNFFEMRIAHGSMFHFTESPVSVKVVGDRKVELEGEELSLTAATRQLLN